jgi:hypothetical protein
LQILIDTTKIPTHQRIEKYVVESFIEKDSVFSKIYSHPAAAAVVVVIFTTLFFSPLSPSCIASAIRNQRLFIANALQSPPHKELFPSRSLVVVPLMRPGVPRPQVMGAIGIGSRDESYSFVATNINTYKPLFQACETTYHALLLHQISRFTFMDKDSVVSKKKKKTD